MKQDPRVDEIFNDALERPPGERRAFLDEVCADAPEIRSRVEKLLALHAEAGGFLQRRGSSIAQQNDGLDPAGRTVQMAPVVKLAAGQILGDRYRIESQLGRGGMGEVWRAFDLKLRVDVALKALHADVFSSEQARELLRREVRTARDVISPNVCRVFDLVVEDDTEFVSMEFIDGRTFHEILDERAPLDLRDAGEIMAQLLAGLEAIHAAGLVHRDVKPENVMVTRAGRVVVMDFGLARAEADGRRTVAGTPAYMAPEQSRGDAVDARADVFSVGVLLAEMVAPGTRDLESRKDLWRGIRENPPRVPEGPLAPLLRKAVAWNANERYPSARAMARALEEIALRADTSQDITPYPGLASFTEEDTQYFFGRESEVEAVGKKVQQLALLAVIGPSGVGKSSFLRAGLIPTLPEGWTHLVCTPGSAPFTALAHGFASHVSGDTHAIKQLLHLNDPGVAIDVARRWRAKHEGALLVVDQFEELFTLNPIETQRSFADVLAKVALEADVHVLLSMRDDFLFHCHEFGALDPIFSELTPLGRLSGPSLRRALVQPALACGYRFEDESLIDQMVQDVSEERGALPLLAFAAAKMWERRERETGTLTRLAYQEIGGVAGALAQHAEAVMEALGSDREPVVRELFRNLVTAQGTRAVRDVDELLTVFEEPQEADFVLRQLIDARLLTSFEVPGREEGENGPGRHVEIVHESLLSAWPRLVRWQTQDADGALLRDQLRQGAQLWRERSCSDDLLWSGTAFREFQVWRENYPGRLTEQEEEFATAMIQHDERQRIRRRRLAVGGVTTLVTVLLVIGVLWQQAKLEARRAEARNVLSHGEDVLDRNVSMAFAYALASLELADDEEARRFALRALQTAPIYIRPPGSSVTPGTPPDALVDFSPDGEHLAVGLFSSEVNIWARNGRLLQTLASNNSFISWVDYARESDAVLAYPFAGGNPAGEFEVRVWRMPDPEPLRTLKFPERTVAFLDPAATSIVTVSQDADTGRWRRWPLPEGPPEELGRGHMGIWNLKVDRPRRRMVYSEKSDIFVESFELLPARQPEKIGKHPEPITAVAFDEDGQRVASADESGLVRVWFLEEDRAPLELQSPDPEKIGFLRFSPDGRWLAGAVPGIGAAEGVVWLWKLDGLLDALPLELGIRNETTGGVFNVSFHPTQRWLASGSNGGPALWPLDHEYGQVLPEGPAPLSDVAVDPEGDWLVASSQNASLVHWPLSARSHFAISSGVDARGGIEMAMDPRGDFVLIGMLEGPRLLDLHEGTTRKLEGWQGSIWAVAVSPSGSRFAVGGGQNIVAERLVRVYERDRETITVLDLGPDAGRMVTDLQFVSDELLLEVLGAGTEAGGVWLWDLETQSHQKLVGENRLWAAVSADRRTFVSVKMTKTGNILHGPLFLYDFEIGDERPLPTFGDDVSAVTFAPDGRIVAGTSDGAILVGFPDAEPHLLLGHRSMVQHVRMMPDGRLVSACHDKTVRIWPLPDPSEPPLHALPYDELMERLREVTNLRMVKDESSFTGYRMTIESFEGWNTLPAW